MFDQRSAKGLFRARYICQTGHVPLKIGERLTLTISHIAFGGHGFAVAGF